MSLTEIIVAIVTGAVAGWLASLIMGTKGGLIRNIVIGILGGFVGNFLFGLLHINFSLALGPINLATIIIAVIGACILVFIANKLFK